MTWDINRDCDQRKEFGQGEDNLYQTGQPPATFVNHLSTILNKPWTGLEPGPKKLLGSRRHHQRKMRTQARKGLGKTKEAISSSVCNPPTLAIVKFDNSLAYYALKTTTKNIGRQNFQKM